MYILLVPNTSKENTTSVLGADMVHQGITVLVLNLRGLLVNKGAKIC